MCGRYYVDDDSREIQKILKQLDSKYESSGRATKEIYPSNTVPILVSSLESHRLEPVPLTWGYPNPYKKSILINARSETALEKPTFRDSVKRRRCIVPSSGYYEWDGAGYKYLIHHSEKDMLYMAGLYQFYDGIGKFVILTTGANRSVRDVHHRMPLVLKEEELEPWLYEESRVDKILYEVPPMLIYTEVVTN